MPADEQKLWTVWGKSDGLYNSWAASRNINYYLLLVLYALEGQKAMTQKKICICTGLTKQTVNSVIRSLKKDDYIELEGKADCINRERHCLFQRTFNTVAGTGTPGISDYGKRQSAANG